MADGDAAAEAHAGATGAKAAADRPRRPSRAALAAGGDAIFCQFLSQFLSEVSKQLTRKDFNEKITMSKLEV